MRRNPLHASNPPFCCFFVRKWLAVWGGEWGWGTLVWIWRRGATWAPSIFYLFDSTCDWKSVPSRRRRDIRKARKQILESRTPPPPTSRHTATTITITPTTQTTWNILSSKLKVLRVFCFFLNCFDEYFIWNSFPSLGSFSRKWIPSVSFFFNFLYFFKEKNTFYICGILPSEKWKNFRNIWMDMWTFKSRCRVECISKDFGVFNHVADGMFTQRNLDIHIFMYTIETQWF